MIDLAVFRQQNKLSQKDAASLFDCSQSFISQIENGKRPIPDEFISKIKANKKYKIDDFYDIINQNSTLPGIKCTNPDCITTINKLKGELESERQNRKILLEVIEQLQSEKGAVHSEKRDSGSVEESGETRKTG